MNNSVRRRLAKEEKKNDKYRSLNIVEEEDDYPDKLNHAGKRHHALRLRAAAMGRCRHWWRYGGIVESKKYYYCEYCDCEKYKTINQ